MKDRGEITSKTVPSFTPGLPEELSKLKYANEIQLKDIVLAKRLAD